MKEKKIIYNKLSYLVARKLLTCINIYTLTTIYALYVKLENQIRNSILPSKSPSMSKIT